MKEGKGKEGTRERGEIGKEVRRSEGRKIKGGREKEKETQGRNEERRRGIKMRENSGRKENARNRKGEENQIGSGVEECSSLEE